MQLLPPVRLYTGIGGPFAYVDGRRVAPHDVVRLADGLVHVRVVDLVTLWSREPGRTAYDQAKAAMYLRRARSGVAR